MKAKPRGGGSGACYECENIEQVTEGIANRRGVVARAPARGHRVGEAQGVRRQAHEASRAHEVVRARCMSKGRRARGVYPKGRCVSVKDRMIKIH